MGRQDEGQKHCLQNDFRCDRTVFGTDTVGAGEDTFRQTDSIGTSAVCEAQLLFVCCRDGREMVVRAAAKLLFISRLTYIVRLQGKEYYKRYMVNNEGNYVANRKLSNLLNRYKDEELPHLTGRIYTGYL